MAETAVAEVSADDDEHNAMAFRLVDIKLNKHLTDLHPSLARIDLLRQEWKFQYRLLWLEWNMTHWMAFITGAFAFIIGAVSGEVLSGGDAKVVGMEGMSSISGFDYFQILLSIVLWIWFIVQCSLIFPIMRGHLLNMIIVWVSLMAAQMLFHVSAPDFPLEIETGDMLGGIILVAIAVFFTYFFWKAVTETRDLHVQGHHVHSDVRLMEVAMREHSLQGWTVLLGGWIVLMIINSWSGAHFIADRYADRTGSLIVHLITGVLSVGGLMHILWFPQRMLGTEATVQTRAAFRSDTSNEEEKDIALQGSCSSCGSDVDVKRSESGEITISCPQEDCQGKGISGDKCSECEKRLPSRIACPSCGLNAPVIDFLPDSEAW
jgi:hypothetical protein